MPRFNLGLFQKKFLSTSKVTGPAINMGCTRGRGSTTRMFNYCNQRSENPSLCINDFITIQKPSSSEIQPISPTVPSAPTITSITPSSTQLVVNFTTPSNDGGSPITNYKYSTNNGLTFFSAGTTSSPITISGLNPITSYQVVIRAVNSVGDGAISTPISATTTGAVWSALLSGLAGGTGNELIIDSLNNVYVGGNFTSANSVPNTNRIAKWNGTAWSSLAGGISGIGATSCSAVNVDSLNNLYVGGLFNTLINNPGTIPANSIAKWDGTNWSALIDSSTGTPINGLQPASSCNTIGIDSLNNVYAGGTFTKLGDNSTTANRIAKWNPTNSTWSTLGSGLGSICNAIVCDSANNVYAGGVFTTLGDGTPANYIAKWNGSSWSALIDSSTGTPINGLNSNVSALGIDSLGNIYVGGGFTRTGPGVATGGIEVNRIAKWNPTTSTWSALIDSSSGIPIIGLNTNSVLGLVIDSTDNVYVTGTFTTTGTVTTPGIVVNRIAKWNPNTSTWTALGSGIPPVGGVGVDIDSNGNVYVCGNFSSAGGNPANNIAKYG